MSSLGFTLIEVMVVVTIIGLLSSTVLVATTSSRASARDASQVNEIKQIQNALELYRVRNGDYPCLIESDPGCITVSVNPVEVSDPDDIYFSNVIAPFYNVSPSDTPSWVTTITYDANTTDRNAYRLNARFERDRRNSAGVTIPAGTWCRVDYGRIDSTVTGWGNPLCF